MCYATKTSDVISILKGYIDAEISLEQALKLIRKHYPADDKDITDNFIIEEYKSLLHNENK